MEAAIGAASWLVDKVVTQLSDELVAAYIASTELGLNMEQIKRDLMFMQGLLHHARERRDKSNPGLQGLLEELRKKADEAEDVLDELQYFIIQDQIDGTHEATPVVDDGIRGQVLHGRHALRHTIGSFQQLEQLSVDSISAVLVAPICNLLASTLCKMEFPYDMWMESFTETQEEALQLLTSLQCLGFYVCPRLQSLPEGLHRLSSLRELIIHKCPEIRALPKEGFPASLRYVFAYEGISVDLKDQLKKLKASTPGLRVVSSLTNLVN
ncbi:uncharacterized protein [Oryza sativa Japonica Group]|uniref:uncharacterized protein isoform X2 n=1 Tax=Oryza sativa subsp. japonica TaxID=39947 RepID=UPI00339C6503